MGHALHVTLHALIGGRCPVSGEGEATGGKAWVGHAALLRLVGIVPSALAPLLQGCWAKLMRNVAEWLEGVRT